ncbi:hypothetical protein [Streptomyces sp. NPDC102437]|uniref:hypothetical protein n=1 Tax=Streptomyces sp. NPDC102437 TaxID=3366175 RepID=UPI00382187CE
MTNDDRKLREEQQAAALREVADLGKRRADLLRQAEELLKPLGDAAVKAVHVGAPRRRTQDLAQVSTGVFYAWLQEAGIEVRGKRPARKKGEEGTLPHTA